MAEKFKYTLRFSKRGEMRYVSHLDLMRLFQRASRRAQLPVAVSEGFSPRPKISIYPAVKLGEEAPDLTADFALSLEMETENFKALLQKQLPEGITILGVEKNA